MKMFLSFGRRCVAWCVVAASANSAFAEPGVPRPNKVLIVVEENRSFNQILGSGSAPYINQLAMRGALFTRSFALARPSQPNYIALFSGAVQGVSDNMCRYSLGGPNLGRALLDAGLGFAGYSESLPAEGSSVCESANQLYVRTHAPWVNFTNLPPTVNKPFTQFPTNFNDLPTLSFVIPNTDNDMHNGPGVQPVINADRWLKDHIDPYIRWAETNNSLFILTFDEDNGNEGNYILTLFVGPMVRPGRYCEKIDHYTVLRTLLQMYDLPLMGNTFNIPTITSCWKREFVQSPLSIDLTGPRDGTVYRPGDTIELSANVSANDTAINFVEFWRGRDLVARVLQPPWTYQLRDVASGNYCFFARIADTRGISRDTPSVEVNVTPRETTRPTVLFTFPPANARIGTPEVVLWGLARDNQGLSRVEVQVGTSAPQVASLNARLNFHSFWTATLPLEPGPNIVRARSFDLNGRESATISRTFHYVVADRLQLLTNGPGRVRPNLDGQLVELGKTITLNATPAPRHIFAGWSGDSNSRDPRLSILMQSNTILVANFVTNPFISLKGNYCGLFREADLVRPESSGAFTLTLAEPGTFTGRLQMGGHRFPFTGRFGADGQAFTTVPLGGGAFWPMTLTLNPLNRQVTGFVTNSAWSAVVLADRMFTYPRNDPSPHTGLYTLGFPGAANALAAPGGDSVASLRVTPEGVALLTGHLGDGTPLVARAPVARRGEFPLHSALYSGGGSIAGWLTFTNTGTDNLSGRMNWFKPVRLTDRLYAGGFSHEAPVAGWTYQPPVAPGERVVNITDGLVAVSNGDIDAGFTNQVTLGANHRVTNLSPNPLTMTLTPATGLWTGSVTDPASARVLSMKGVVSQRNTNGFGFFLGSSQSGRVLFQAR